jgi:hypothetical protein
MPATLIGQLVIHLRIISKILDYKYFYSNAGSQRLARFKAVIVDTIREMCQ